MRYSNDGFGKLHLSLFFITIFGLFLFFHDEINESFSGNSAEASVVQEEKDYLLVVNYGFEIELIESSKIVKDKELANVYKYKSDVKNTDTMVEYTVPKSYEVYFFDNVTKDQYEELRAERLDLF